jgi:hypothetical protein
LASSFAISNYLFSEFRKNVTLTLRLEFHSSSDILGFLGLLRFCGVPGLSRVAVRRPTAKKSVHLPNPGFIALQIVQGFRAGSIHPSIHQIPPRPHEQTRSANEIEEPIFLTITNRQPATKRNNSISQSHRTVLTHHPRQHASPLPATGTEPMLNQGSVTASPSLLHFPWPHPLPATAGSFHPHDTGSALHWKRIPPREATGAAAAAKSCSHQPSMS